MLALIPRAPRQSSRLPFEVHSYNAAKRPHLKFEVRGVLNGKPLRKFFETEREAKTFAHLRNTEVLQFGADGAQTPLWVRLMADECQELLAPFKKNFRDATQHYVSYLQERERSCTVEKLFAQLVDTKRAAGVSQTYQTNLKRVGRDLALAFPGKLISEFTTRDFNEFLMGLKSQNGTSRNYWRRLLIVAFTSAKAHGYCAEIHGKGAFMSKVIAKPVGILHPDELARLLAAAPAGILPALAIGAFAGLRTAELARLDWREVDLESGFIEVTAKNAKSSRRRLVTIMPNLAAWLRPFAKTSGPVSPGVVQYCVLRKQTLEKAGLPEWPKNALRHSFASYHLAHFKDTSALALQMGHTTNDLIFEHYRQIVRPAKAAEYWQVAPFSCPATASILAFTPQGYTWCLNVFSFADDYLDGPEELARYFGVHRSNVYYWFENPNAPARTPDNRFDVVPWREFVRNHTRTEADAAGKLGSSFFAAHAVSASREHRRYFRTEADARTYAEQRNRERLAKEVRLEDVANVVDFKAAADRHAAAPATAAK